MITKINDYKAQKISYQRLVDVLIQLEEAIFEEELIKEFDHEFQKMWFALEEVLAVKLEREERGEKENKEDREEDEAIINEYIPKLAQLINKNIITSPETKYD